MGVWEYDLFVDESEVISPLPLASTPSPNSISKKTILVILFFTPHELTRVSHPPPADISVDFYFFVQILVAAKLKRARFLKGSRCHLPGKHSLSVLYGTTCRHRYLQVHLILESATCLWGPATWYSF
jgi:hypothetical protein